MPRERLSSGVLRAGPEVIVGVLASAVFLGFLGSLDLWGKREQRLSAEAIDTIDHHHWLVAEIQGHPRLEKPPLPRWMIAGLMAVTGRRDEWIVRLPGACCALATVALVYMLGRRMGGRPLGLASALVLCSLGFFVTEMRQAGSDGPLALFVTLALCAAWALLEDGGSADRSASARAGRLRVDRLWSLVFYAAMGLGFLTKGPVILMLAAATILPYLILTRRLVPGLRRLADGRGVLLFVALAASWPGVVWWQEPIAWRIWLVEMSEKTGIGQTLPHHRHSPMVVQWPGMMLPWPLIAMVAIFLPFLRVAPAGTDRRAGSPEPATATTTPPIWFLWFWSIGSLGIFSLWSIAKPSYYVPCLPGMALMIGAAWIRLTERARVLGRGGSAARAVLQAQWVLLFVAAVVAPIVDRSWLSPVSWAWTIVMAAVLGIAVIASGWLWRRGGGASLSLAPIATASVVACLVVYGLIAPAQNPRRGHRDLARTLHRLLPDIQTIRFFNEIDEGLGFYLPDLAILPVPGTQPRYSTSYDLAEAYRTRPDPRVKLEDLDAERQDHDRRALLGWLASVDPKSPYLLMRASLYDRLSGALAGKVIPLYRESGLARNELVLLQVAGPWPVATAGGSVRY